ncbi:MAG: hypothetical protein LBV16_06995 [Elusimicrobiota bacterium]|jgi:hypothetical protein|nr:hypothetical protein [Elusimicrobiota bacterium]
MKNRILALIDGFNYYHKINIYQRKFKSPIKWINYRTLIESFLNDTDDKTNAEIIHFSALAKYIGIASVQRHKTYLFALNFLNIEIILGNFKYKSITKCNNKENI